MKTLIVFYSRKGFIREAAERLKDLLGDDADLLDLKMKSQRNPDAYEAIVLAGAFAAGQMPGKLRRFVKKNGSVLENRNIAFLLGGLGTEEKEWRPSFEKNFSPELRSRARTIVHAGGRYEPASHNRIVRRMMEQINSGSGAIHKEDWDALGELARQLHG